jgi:hypothetical protein
MPTTDAVIHRQRRSASKKFFVADASNKIDLVSKFQFLACCWTHYNRHLLKIQKMQGDTCCWLRWFPHSEAGIPILLAASIFQSYG